MASPSNSRLSVVLVSAYLFVVAVWLLLTFQIKAPGLPRLLRGLFRKPFVGNLADIRPEHGHCWIASMPDYLPSDADSASSVTFLEDGNPLGPAHAAHADIRERGGGLFSHWGAQIYFSTSDNSDPRTNGRRYRVEEAKK